MSEDGSGSVRVAVFASGGGTTLQALLDRAEAIDKGWHVGLVLSDRQDAGALERARDHGVPTVVVSDRGRSADDVARETIGLLEDHDVQVVCLAGYLRLVPKGVVEAFEGRMLNVHPALLPAFGGKGMYGDRVHRAVLEAGVRLTGPTVHLVDAEYDRGLPLAQWPVPVLPEDTVPSLRSRVQAAERALYPVVVDRLAEAVSQRVPIESFGVAAEHFSASPDAEPAERSSGVAQSVERAYSGARLKG